MVRSRPQTDAGYLRPRAKLRNPKKVWNSPAASRHRSASFRLLTVWHCRIFLGNSSLGSEAKVLAILIAKVPASVLFRSDNKSTQNEIVRERQDRIPRCLRNLTRHESLSVDLTNSHLHVSPVILGTRKNPLSLFDTPLDPVARETPLAPWMDLAIFWRLRLAELQKQFAPISQPAALGSPANQWGE
jgi:hypothetical protein